MYFFREKLHPPPPINAQGTPLDLHVIVSAVLKLLRFVLVTLPQLICMNPELICMNLELICMNLELICMNPE